MRLHSTPGHTCYYWRGFPNSFPPQMMGDRSQSHQSYYNGAQILLASLVRIQLHRRISQCHGLFHMDL